MEVADWLRQQGLEQYEAAFRENDVTPMVLASLTAEDLKDLGIISVGHRRQLLEAIAALRAEVMPATNPIQASPSQSTAERRLLSVMFCDVIGSTAMSYRLDPEDLSSVIRGYQSCVATTIARFGGFVARYVGDGVLIYFGWPEAQEVDAEQAVRAALAVIDAIGQASTPMELLQLRIGIATGLAVVGEPIGTGESRQQTAIGETPNLAARLQGLAEPEQHRYRCHNPQTDRWSLRLPGSRIGHPEGPAAAGAGLAGGGRVCRRGSVRGISRRFDDAADRPRRGVRPVAAALAAGKGRRRPTGAAVRRAWHGKVAPDRRTGGSAPRRAAANLALFLLTAPSGQRPPPDCRAVGARLEVHPRRHAAGATAQARGGGHGKVAGRNRTDCRHAVIAGGRSLSER